MASPLANVTALLHPTGVISAFRKRIRATKIVEMDWVEIVGMTAGLILLAMIVVAVILVMGVAAFLVIPVAVPVAALALVLVGLAKLAARSADDE